MIITVRSLTILIGSPVRLLRCEWCAKARCRCKASSDPSFDEPPF